MAAIIETSNLTKLYRKNIIGIQDLSIRVEEGEIFGFLGSNGAGKTTTIRLLMSLISPNKGSIRIFGMDLPGHRLEICKNIGYIPSSIQPHRNMTGYDFLDFMGRMSADVDDRFRDAMYNRFKLSKRDLDRKIKDYSTGMARKLSIIQAFQHRPILLILDEPTEGLDPVMQHEFYELLKEYRDNGGTVFISSHHLREVELICDRAGIIRAGKLVTEAKIETLMAQTNRRIRVRFTQPVNPSELVSDDWEILRVNGSRVDARLTGNLNHIIKLLNRFEIADLALPDKSLQDVFLNFYQGSES